MKKFEDKIIPLIEEMKCNKCSRRSYEQKHNGNKPTVTNIYVMEDRLFKL